MKLIPVTINGRVEYINSETIVKLYVNHLYEIKQYRVEAIVANNTVPVPLSPCLSEEEAKKALNNLLVEIGTKP